MAEEEGSKRMGGGIMKLWVKVECGEMSGTSWQKGKRKSIQTKQINKLWGKKKLYIDVL